MPQKNKAEETATVCLFLFDLGKVIGGLNDQHVLADLKRIGITEDERNAAYEALKKISNAFLNDVFDAFEAMIEAQTQ
jgi:flagellar biosynthesis regulator FlbT